MGGFEDLLMPHLGWLQGRARHHAGALRRGGYGSVESLGDDIMQETLLRAVRKAPAWFDGPSQDPAARMRELLVWSLKQAVTRLQRTRRWSSLPSSDEEALEEGFELRATDRGDPEEEIVRRLEDSRKTRSFLADVRSRLNPAYRLTVLAVYFPEEVQYEDILEASRHRMGGARPVTRDPGEAWALLRSKLEPFSYGMTEWKRAVAEIFRSSSPLGASPEDLVRREVNRLDVHLSRARKTLGVAPEEVEP